MTQNKSVEEFATQLSKSVRYSSGRGQYDAFPDCQDAYLDGVETAIAMMYIDLTGGYKSEGMLAKFIQQERQTSQEREREIVVNEVIEIIESVQLTATKKYADDTTPEKAKVVNDWLMPEVKRNIIEAVKTLTNPNKD